MTTTETKITVTSWASPTVDDDRMWDSLTRAEQVDALRDRLTSQACTTPAEATVAELVQRTRATNRAVRGRDDHKL